MARVALLVSSGGTDVWPPKMKENHICRFGVCWICGARQASPGSCFPKWPTSLWCVCRKEGKANLSPAAAIQGWLPLLYVCRLSTHLWASLHLCNPLCEPPKPSPHLVVVSSVGYLCTLAPRNCHIPFCVLNNLLRDPALLFAIRRARAALRVPGSGFHMPLGQLGVGEEGQSRHRKAKKDHGATAPKWPIQNAGVGSQKLENPEAQDSTHTSLAP